MSELQYGVILILTGIWPLAYSWIIFWFGFSVLLLCPSLWMTSTTAVLFIIKLFSFSFLKSLEPQIWSLHARGERRTQNPMFKTWSFSRSRDANLTFLWINVSSLIHHTGAEVEEVFNSFTEAQITIPQYENIKKYSKLYLVKVWKY